MSSFDFLIPLVAIIVGLAFSDLAASIHRLLRARQRVRWHWFPLSGAVFLVLLSLEIWWSLGSLFVTNGPVTIGTFLPLLVELFLLFLLASAALPDEVPAEGIDLREYYLQNARYFWTLFTALLLAFMLHRLVTAVVLSGSAAIPGTLRSMIPNYILVGVTFSLVLVRRVAWHALWLLVLPIVYLVALVGRSLPSA